MEIINIIQIIICFIILIVTCSNLYIFYKIKQKQGPKGDKGIKGPSGDQGDEGPKGDTGISGHTGPKGIIAKDIGLKGLKGPIGLKGPAGNRGPRGDIGLQGIIGEKGNTGVKGDDGNSGKNGFRGPLGNNRVIKEDDLTIIANKNKCIRLKDKDKFLKCPKNMAVFNMDVKKKEKILNRRNPDSDLNSITCCEIDISNPEYDNFFSGLEILLLLTEAVGIRTNYSSYNTLKKKLIDPRLSEDQKDEVREKIKNVKYKEYFDKFNLREMKKLESNLNIIIDLINNFGARKSPRDIDYPYPNTNINAGDKIFLQQILGSDEEAKKVKIYTREQEQNILKSFDSITSYELYILRKIAGFKKTKTNGKEKEPDIDYDRIFNEFFEFPFNDLKKLEEDNIYKDPLILEEESEFFDNLDSSENNTESSFI